MVQAVECAFGMSARNSYSAGAEEQHFAPYVLTTCWSCRALVQLLRGACTTQDAALQLPAHLEVGTYLLQGFLQPLVCRLCLCLQF